MRSQLIKSTYGLWLKNIYKSLADINTDFMKPYFLIKEMPYNLRYGCALQLASVN